MKKVLIGLAAGLGVALVVYKLAKDGKLDYMYDDANKMAGKAKRTIKNSIDVSKNQLEYLKERAISKTDQLNNMVEDAEKSLMDKFNKSKV